MCRCGACHQTLQGSGLPLLQMTAASGCGRCVQGAAVAPGTWAVVPCTVWPGAPTLLCLSWLQQLTLESFCCQQVSLHASFMRAACALCVLCSWAPGCAEPRLPTGEAQSVLRAPYVSPATSSRLCCASLGTTRLAQCSTLYLYLR